MDRKRPLIFYTALTLVFTALLIRVFFIMRDGSELTVLARGRSYSVTLAPLRGDITDRNGESLLCGNTEYYAVCVPPFERAEYIARRLSESGGGSYEKLLEKARGAIPFAVPVNDRDLRFENTAVIGIPGRYSADGVAAHLTGYIGDGAAGVCGLELAFNDALTAHGSVNASVSVGARDNALSGVTLRNSGTGGVGGIRLTVDRKLSELVRYAFESASENTLGAVVVMDVSDGDILACESFPGYDRTDIIGCLNDKSAPLVNRAFTAFNIGSAFKIISTVALLENGRDGTTYTCNGSIPVGDRNVACHYADGHGRENLSAAFANSCNPYFINALISLGGDAAYETAEKFGIGRAYILADGIATDGGILTDKRTLRVDAALANFSIGQGDLMVTPIQAAVMVSAVANGGLRVTPRLVTSVYDDLGDTTEAFESEPPVRIISEETALTVREFMINAIETGTGKRAKPDTGGAGGKTATAQTGSFADGVRLTNAWFVGFYPAAQPRYAIVVLAENGGSGARNAAPVFKMICDYLAE